MQRVERDVHKLVLAQHVGDDESCFSVITLGEESFGEDLDALRNEGNSGAGVSAKVGDGIRRT
jgi:hypothetical protein